MPQGKAFLHRVLFLLLFFNIYVKERGTKCPFVRLPVSYTHLVLMKFIDSKGVILKEVPVVVLIIFHLSGVSGKFNTSSFNIRCV